MHLGKLGSSVDPTKLSVTVQGIFVGGAVLIVLLAQWLGFTITSDEVTQFGVQVGTLISEFMIVGGIIRKVVLALYNKYRGL